MRQGDLRHWNKSIPKSATDESIESNYCVSFTVRLHPLVRCHPHVTKDTHFSYCCQKNKLTKKLADCFVRGLAL